MQDNIHNIADHKKTPSAIEVVTPTEIARLLAVQAVFDEGVVHNTTQERCPLVNAMMELGEYAGHRGFETWKKVKTNKLQAALELVDAFAFLLQEANMFLAEQKQESPELVAFLDGKPMEVLTSLLTRNIRGCYNALVELAEEGKAVSEHRILVIAVADLKGSMPDTIGAMMYLASAFCGVSPTNFIRMYEAKMILNKFRQDHGYSKGTYIKQWGSQEDNVVMAELIVAEVELSNIYDRLEGLYNLLPKLTKGNHND